MRILSLDHLTVMDLTPPQVVRTAAEAGFSHVGLRLKPAAPTGEGQHPMVGDTPMRRETMAALRDTGVVLFDWGVLRLKADTVVADFEPWFETAALLGARNVMVNGDAPDDALLADLFGQACALGQRYQNTLHFEATPWTHLRTLAQAARIVQAAGQANGRVLVDTLHVDRVGNTAADIAALPAGLVAMVQVCDGVAPRPTDFETMIFQARNERAFPGEGGIPLAEMLRALPADCPISLECPTKYRAQGMSALDRARLGLRATNNLLAVL